MKKILLSSIFAIAVAAGPVHSQVLVEYLFTGGTAVGTNVAANTTAGNASWTGLTGTNYGFSAGNNDAFARFDSVAVSALDSTRYMQFTLSANSGFTLNLSSISFRIGITNSATFDRTAYAIARTSADTFSANLTLTPGPTSTASITGNSSSGTIYSNFSASLGGPSFSNLTSFTLRLYPFVSAPSANNAFARFDTVVLSGEVIPEPSVWGLLAFGLTVFVVFRRRRAIHA